MAVIVQQGVPVEVGVGTDTITGYIMGTVNRKPTGTVRTIEREEDGATGTVLVANRGVTFSFDMITKAGVDAKVFIMAGTVTVNGVVYRIEDAEIVKTKGEEQTVRLDVIKEDSITYV